MNKKGFGKYHSLILVIVFLLFFSFGIGTVFYEMTGNDFWRYFDFAIFDLLLVSLFMRVVFDLLLKQFLENSYRKVALISFFAMILYFALKFVMKLFAEGETFLALIPIIAPLVGFVVFYYISKEKSIEKRVKIAVFSILALAFGYSVFCEVNILMELFA